MNEEEFLKKWNFELLAKGKNWKPKDGIMGLDFQFTRIIGDRNAGRYIKAIEENETGLEGKALYVDTEGTFRPERIVPIAKRFGLDPEDVLQNIIVTRAFSSDHQIAIIRKAKKEIPLRNIKLVIVDSLTNHFRAEYVGIDTLAVRQQKINVHLHDLHRIAYAFNTAVVVTNQVLVNPATFFGNPIHAIGGNIVAHNITTRVSLRKSKGNKRVAKMEDSPYLPESEVVFEISDSGIIDSSIEE